MIKLIIDGEEFIFVGDELISAEQQAILFLQDIDQSKRAF